MIIFPEYSNKYKEVLGRLIKGEKTESVIGIIALNRYLITRMQLFTMAVHLPKLKPKETSKKYCQRWMKKFNERQKLVIEFTGAWQSQILVTLLKIYQAGVLLGNPISDEERSKRNIQNETEWYELILPPFQNEIYVWQNRLLDWLGTFKNAVKEHEGPQKLISDLEKACNAIRNEVDGLIEFRHIYIHPRFDRKFEKDLRMMNLMKIILEHYPGGEKIIEASKQKQNKEMRSLTPKLAIAVKRKLLSLLNRYSGLITETIRFLIPGFR